MADFQNRLISRIFSAFSSGFLQKKTRNEFRKDFDMLFGILIFDPK